MITEYYVIAVNDSNLNEKYISKEKDKYVVVDDMDQALKFMTLDRAKAELNEIMLTQLPTIYTKVHKKPNSEYVHEYSLHRPDVTNSVWGDDPDNHTFKVLSVKTEVNTATSYKELDFDTSYYYLLSEVPIISDAQMNCPLDIIEDIIRKYYFYRNNSEERMNVECLIKQLREKLYGI